MKVTVERRHIDNGERNQYSTCPVALAIQELTGCYCEVSEYYVVVERGENEGENCEAQELPNEVRIAINDYDDGKGMTELSFDLPDDEWEKCDDHEIAP